MNATTPPARTLWADVSHQLHLDEPPAASAPRPIGQRRRRGYSTQASDSRAMVELMRDDDDLLRWVYTPPPSASGSGRRAYRSFRIDERSVVQRFRFNDLGRNAVTEKLIDLDDWLTPGRGMKRWNGQALVDDPAPDVGSGRVLLLVHGTFSESAMWFDELSATPGGRDLLQAWQGTYAAILAFNHHTLSVGAWSNALDLHSALKGVLAPIDIVCHSRGGLVATWLLRLDPLSIERVVLVGSPLVGTSLAAPDKLRAALDLLANYAEVVTRIGQAGAAVVPLAGGVAALAKIFGRMLRLGSGLPIVDAAVSLVPGLSTQQRGRDNLDLRQLFERDWAQRPQMTAVGVTFQPDESREPLWKFWKRFSNIGNQMKFAAADLVFPGPNDLVVDVDSMFRLGEQVNIPFVDLGTRPDVHHTNYFRDAAVLDCLRQKLD